MTTSEELEMTFKKVGNDFGLKNVTVSYSALKDLKLRWVRGVDWAEFTCSDFLEPAPLDVVENIAKVICGKIRGMETKYSPETVRWLTSHEFRQENQEKYIRRNITIDRNADTVRLYESYQRLKSIGKIPELEDLKMFWSATSLLDTVGRSSCLMRVAVMNSRLLQLNVSDEILDYCVMKELANISIGFSEDNSNREEEIENMLETMNNSMLTRSWLREANLIE